MIEVFFNKTGYYIIGPNIEIAKSVNPLKIEGENVLTDLQHLYAVLSMVLIELLSNPSSKEDITIYSDSRLIEDMRGITSGMDELCVKTVRYLRRKVIPSIKGVIFFRKKSSDYINSKIKSGQDALIGELDDSIKDREIAKVEQTIADNNQQNKRNRIQNFKQDWFGK